MTAPFKWVGLILRASILIALCVFTACNKLTAPIDPTGVSDPSRSPFNIKLEMAFESTTGDDAFTEFASCGFDHGTALGSSKTCNIEIPEETLYFSKIRFTTDYIAANCEMIHYRPYYYLASLSGAFVPLWGDGTTVDCTTSPTPLDCYSGPATELVEEFPAYTGLYQIIESVTESSYTWPEFSSANTKQRLSNRWAANNLSTASQAAGVAITGDGLVANRFRDYVFSCTDIYAEPQYAITLILSDINSTIDHFEDWSTY